MNSLHTILRDHSVACTGVGLGWVLTMGVTMDHGVVRVSHHHVTCVFVINIPSVEISTNGCGHFHFIDARYFLFSATFKHFTVCSDLKV